MISFNSLQLTIAATILSFTSVYATPQGVKLFSIHDTTNPLGASSFEGMGKWNDCGEGKIIAGFKNTWDANCGDRLHCLEGIQCVSPLEYPVKTKCYDKDISSAFDDNGSFRTVKCDAGYFLRGLYSYNNNDGNCGIECIEAMRCCQYDTRVLWYAETEGEDDTWYGCLDPAGNYLNKWCLVKPWNFVTGLIRNAGASDSIGLLEKATVRQLYKSTAIHVENFAIIPSRETWNDAQLFCEKHYRGDLATVTTHKQISGILTALKAHNFENEAPWIGINDKTTEGTYKWKSGAACPSNKPILCSTFWDESAGEPNDAGNNEDCGQLRSNGLFNDGDCNTPNYFICNVREFVFEMSGTWLKVPSCIGCSANEYKVTVGVTNIKEKGKSTSSSVTLSETSETNYQAEISAAAETFFGSIEASMSWGGSNTLSSEKASEVSSTLTNSLEHGNSQEFTIQCQKDGIYQWITNIKQKEKTTGISKSFNVNNPDYICLSVPHKPKCGPGACADATCQTCIQ